MGFILLISIGFSCSADKQEPLENNGAIPQQIKVVNVENLPGAAKVYYSLPDDPNILYIRGEYILSNGQKKSVKASTYTNYIEIEGFGRSEQHHVQLYSVSRSEVSSAPVEVDIHPLSALIHDVFETLNVSETFGGVHAVFSNTDKAELILHTMIKDNEGNWINYDRLYSNAPEKRYSIRGLENVSTEFAFYFSDKWNNSSDTLKRTMTPLYERIIDKSDWKNAKLFNDTYIPEFDSWALENLWDNTTSKIFWGHPSKPENLALPNWFTIDLGKKYIFSRIRVNQLNHDKSFMYTGGTPLTFEIWGSNNPSQNGEWDSWTKLGDYTSVKPSGLPTGSLSDEDIRVAIAGEDYDFPVNLPAYRYIRFKTTRTYGARVNIALSELTLWGQQVD
ncbi:DUF5000 domain-containing lipoprotein [Sphingobacterium faecale]|nr:DUF5000 domain-containing lipoprotein [Sphingobacterium faecale]